MNIKIAELSNETVKSICKDMYVVGMNRLFSEEEKEQLNVNDDTSRFAANLLIELKEGFVKQFLEENGELVLRVETGFDEDLEPEYR